MIELTFPESLVITGEHQRDPKNNDSHLICTECKVRLDHQAKTTFLAGGEWVPQNLDALESRGFYINQLYSSTVSPVELAYAYHKGQIDATSETEFYNSKLGMAHTVKGAQVTQEHLDSCKDGYDKLLSGTGLKSWVTMGIDVGRRLHIEIDAWIVPANCPVADVNSYCKPMLVWEGTRPNFENLDDLMRAFGVHFAVVDANPDRRKAVEFANRWFNRVKLCIYGRSENSRQLVLTPEMEHGVTVNRTSWLDLSQGRFHLGKDHTNGIVLPKNVSREYESNVKSLVRQYTREKVKKSTNKGEATDVQGEELVSYVRIADDHYAHARNYSEIALAFAVLGGSSYNIKSPV